MVSLLAEDPPQAPHFENQCLNGIVNHFGKYAEKINTILICNDLI